MPDVQTNGHVTLDERRNVYVSASGQEYLRVTRILEMVGLRKLPSVSEAVLAYAAERGQVAHDAIALDLEGDLVESSVHDEVRPYLEAARAWIAANGFRPEPGWIERRLAHAELRFAGKLDLLGRIGDDLWIVDWKTVGGAIEDDVGVQLAAYELLARAQGRKGRIRRVAVRLGKDGTPRPRIFDHPGDLADFMAALRIAWRIAAREGEGGSRGGTERG